MSTKRKKVIVAISGKAGTGKDTIANYLCSEFGFQIIRIADPIKKITSEATKTTLPQNYMLKSLIPDISQGELEGWDLGKYQQVVGKIFRKGICEDFWVRRMIVELEKTEYDRIAIPDLRFKNEANTLRRLSAILIRVNRPRDERVKYLGGRDEFDISETDLDNYMLFDKNFDNKSTVKTLEEKVGHFMKQVKPGLTKE